LTAYICDSADYRAAQAVLQTLGEPAVARIRFKIENFAVKPEAYALVARLIRQSRIEVQHDPSLGTTAYYSANSNLLQVGFTAASTVLKRGLVIHECTHAAFDALAYTRATVALSESAAFTAQCLFVRINWPGEPGPDDRLYNDDDAKDLVFERAWHIALKIWKRQAPSAKDYAELKDAVLHHPDYRHGNQRSGWNGV
jgi:hypothetical protein